MSYLAYMRNSWNMFNRFRALSASFMSGNELQTCGVAKESVLLNGTDADKNGRDKTARPSFTCTNAQVDRFGETQFTENVLGRQSFREADESDSDGKESLPPFQTFLSLKSPID